MLHISPEIILGSVNKQATEHCNDEKQMTDDDEKQVLHWYELSRWHSDFLMIFFPSLQWWMFQRCKAEWSTSMSRLVPRNCWRQLSYAIKNQLVASLLGALERKIPLGGYFACSSLVLYLFYLYWTLLCQKEPPRDFECPSWFVMA